MIITYWKRNKWRKKRFKTQEKLEKWVKKNDISEYDFEGLRIMIL